MARGTKLNPETIWGDGLSPVRTNLNSANVANTDGMISSQYEKDKASFRLNFSIPYIGSEWTKTNGTDKPYVVPFMLPPLQEFWDVQGLSDQDTPTLIMTEFSFSFDQRNEGCMITDQHAVPGSDWDALIATAATPANAPNLQCWDHWKTNTNHGKIYQQPELFTTDRGLQLEFSILQKEANYYIEPPSASDYHPTTEIYNIPFDMSAILAAGGSVMPYADKNLSINIDPYQTYLLGIKPINLHSPVQLALVNINVSVKFKHVLVTRDHSGDSHTPCNLPEHGNQKVQDTIALTVPTVNQAIEADTNDGVNTSISTLDKVFQDKLQGGLSPGSDIGVVEHLCQDAGYEVIAIPMWNNQFNNQLTVKNVIASATAPYSIGSAASAAISGVNATVVGSGDLDQRGPIMDRAVIPINFPMTIHHVVVAYNSFTTTINDGDIASTFPYRYQQDPVPTNSYEAAWADGGAVDITSVLMDHQIGIGIGTGHKGLTYGYKQICNYSGNFNTNIVDRIRMNYPASTSNTTPLGLNKNTGLADKPEWTLNYLPLVNQTSATDRSVAPGLYDYAGVKATTATAQNIQNTPIFVGNSWEIPDSAGKAAAPALTSYKGPTIRTDDQIESNLQRGTDQWIEVRWGVNGNVNWGRILQGYGGSWIYIIGKKHTVSDQNWKQHYQIKGANSNG